MVGLVARADPVKAHPIFVRAATSLSERNPRMRFVCVGVGDPTAAASLRRHADELGLTDKMRIEGPRDDVASVYSALDVLVMCSNSEGFPNVVAEAMACGVPCAVTDVGDAVAIVGDTGASTEPGNVTGLTRAVESIVARLQAEGETLRCATRARIVERYSIQALANRTLAALEKSTTRPPKRRVPSN